MTSIAGLNDFNNLLYNTKKIAVANVLEHRAGRVPFDLSYKRPARPDELLNCKRSQINGKYGDLKYCRVFKSRGKLIRRLRRWQYLKT